MYFQIYFSYSSPKVILLSGRDIIIIANDLTYLIGSFGPREDRVFCMASEMSRKLKIPRIYISVNSGARIGLAEEIKALFNIAWEDPDEPDKVKIYFLMLTYCLSLVNNILNKRIILIVLIPNRVLNICT